MSPKRILLNPIDQNPSNEKKNSTQRATWGHLSKIFCRSPIYHPSVHLSTKGHRALNYYMQLNKMEVDGRRRWWDGGTPYPFLSNVDRQYYYSCFGRASHRELSARSRWKCSAMAKKHRADWRVVRIWLSRWRVCCLKLSACKTTSPYS